ncbi:MAG: 2,3-bisphosphoglycerate-dependent phosphoglycerate mutase [Candidatus Diapherotrites archaeon CG08_land_8_20_14_0_20_30_16]|nr:MAG: 2,3-bisphosphoglycerate-dependent phosphoglycerate mutase [Candidatus Diapherotrites archaeon CG08_land_8_20_14_0_20_30_16]
MVKLVLIRHGESVWNKLNEFTGWVDVPLSNKGIKQAINAGKILHKIKIKFDSIYTSELVRAHQTLFHILEQMHLETVVYHVDDPELEKMASHHIQDKELPIYKTIALNERHYGDLQGQNKDEMRKKYGKEQVEIWRRSYNTKPPHGESLEDTLHRTLPYFKKFILPELIKGRNVLIVAHGNSQRAITKYLEHISDKEIPKYEIPLGLPIVYDLDKKMKIKNKLILK